MEFEPAFRWIDVAEEVALLVADLRARGHARHAYAFLSGYLAQSGDFGLCRVLDLYKGHRALTRAKVAALEGARSDHDAQLGEACRSLTPKSPLLVLVTGLSGSGKTWLARRLAPDLGAIHLRSDVERKRLAGLAEHADSRSATGAGLYSAENSERIYAHLAQCAEGVLAGGYPAIVDATFLRRSQRALFVALARRMSVRLQVVHCDAPASLLRNRIEERYAAGGDASEADLAVLDWQLQQCEPIDSAEALDVVKVSASAPDPLRSARETLRH
jgi:predicted kinase